MQRHVRGLVRLFVYPTGGQFVGSSCPIPRFDSSNFFAITFNDGSMMTLIESIVRSTVTKMMTVKMIMTIMMTMITFKTITLVSRKSLITAVTMMMTILRTFMMIGYDENDALLVMMMMMMMMTMIIVMLMIMMMMLTMMTMTKVTFNKMITMIMAILCFGIYFRQSGSIKVQ